MFTRVLKSVLLLLLLVIAGTASAVPPKLLTPSLPNAVINVPYTGRLMIAWATVGGPSVNTLVGLPPGLTFTNNIGNYLISGTPTAAGSFPLTLTATNSPNADSTLVRIVQFRVDQFADNVAAIAAGNQHSCAVVNGGVQCWGSNANGELGNNSTAPSSVSVGAIAPGSGATAVSVGSAHACAVVAGGLQCWGGNGSGQLGNNSNAQSLVPVSVFPPGSNVTAVAAGGNHTCAVINGGVQCWGRNFSGELGNNSFTSSPVPVTAIAPLSGVAVVATGDAHSCAVANGGLRCWGANSLGTLGNGGASNSPVPLTIIAAGGATTAIALGRNHTCAIIGSTLFCWGQNSVGQVPGGVPIERNPLRVGSVPLSLVFTSIAAGDFHTCANSTDGVYCWGSNSGLQVGTDHRTTVPDPVLTLPSGGSSANVITGVATGSAHSCAIVSGRVQCWGTNSIGVLGTGIGVFSTVPVPSLPKGLGSSGGFVDAGRDHTCAKSSPTGISCWGSNASGKLGAGGIQTESNVPVEVALSPSGAINLGLGAWDRHSCAVVNLGVQCWGANEAGQLGNNSIIDSPVPVEVFPPNSDIFLVSTGSAHSCALTYSRILYCWGANNVGQLGIGSNVPSHVPVVTIPGGSNIGSLSARGNHTCAAVNTGVKCWGSNLLGQLGVTVVNGFDHSTVPVDPLPTGSVVQSVAAGESHTCAVISGGVKCWGSNSAGQLGNNNPGSTTVPAVAIAANSGVTWISAGKEHNCVTINAGVQCWGRNTFGQLGNGGTVSSPTPVNVLVADSDVFTVAAGAEHSCASTRTGVVCWGSNSMGQIADAATYSLRKVVAAIPLPTIPGAPFITAAVGGIGSITLSFNPPASNGGLPISGYTATCTSQGFPARTATAGGGVTITITGLTGNVGYVCTMTATNGAGTGLASNGFGATPDVAPLELLDVFSRKTHGTAGIRDLLLNRSADVNGAITIESRAPGGGHRIVFQFNNIIFQSGSATITDRFGATLGSASLSPNGTEVVALLSGIADASRITITLSNVNNIGGGTIALGFLVGDVTGDRLLNTGDVSGVKSRAGQVVSQANFQFDLNATGVIGAADIAAAKARSPSSLP